MLEPSASVATPAVPPAEPVTLGPQARLAPAARHGCFVLIAVLGTALGWQPFTTVIGRSLQYGEYQHYTYIVALPIFAAYLAYLNRRAILAHARLAPRAGLAVAALGAATIWLARTTALTEDIEWGLSFSVLGLVTLWAGGFLGCYGPRALRAAAFPFLLLFLMVPLPPALLDRVIVFLQHGSGELSALLFDLIGMPVLRDGMVFALPGLTIHVARECSGIRSTLALFISGLVIAHLLLRLVWTRVALVLLIVPLAILKNAIRIVVLSWLAIRVDPSFITGSMAHQSGGIPIFIASLAALGALAWVLGRCEPRTRR